MHKNQGLLNRKMKHMGGTDSLVWIFLVLACVITTRLCSAFRPMKTGGTGLWGRRVCGGSAPTWPRRAPSALKSSVKTADELEASEARKELWKEISKLERQAVEILSTSGGSDTSVEDAMKLLSKSVGLKKNDPFLRLANDYAIATEAGNTALCDQLIAEMRLAGLPPHISGLAKAGAAPEVVEDGTPEEVDPGSTFSDTITEKVRVKVNSFYDEEKSDPANGKYMFWYKVAIYNEGPEPVQIVARIWEIEKCKGEKEVVRGAGIMSTQPIIPPGDVFTYQSVCPLKVFPPRGKRVLGSMSGAYTMCKGNMGQHNFSVRVGKFNLVLPSKFAE